MAPIDITINPDGTILLEIPGAGRALFNADNAIQVGLKLVEAARAVKDGDGRELNNIIVKSSRVVELPKVVLRGSAASIYQAFKGNGRST